MWAGINRREFPRAEYPCNITVKRKDNSERISTQTQNIGVGGICIVLPKDLGIFAPVETELDLLDGGPIVVCDGTIVWIVEKKGEENPTFDTGVEFTNLKEEDANRISEIVERILKNTT